MKPRKGSAWLSACILLSGWLAGCAGLPPPAPEQPAAALEAFRLSGRLGVRHGEDGFSGSIDWRHRPASDEVLIANPLGQGVARLVRDAGGVTLVTADQREYRGADVADLTEAVLGWRLPLDHLAQWVQGRAGPGTAVLRRDTLGRPETITQDGWRIDYADWRSSPAGALPARIFVEGHDLRLKLIVDQWEAL